MNSQCPSGGEQMVGAARVSLERAMSEESKQYRKFILEADQKSVAAFDKTLVTLSAGALGISLVFVRDILGAGNLDRGWLVIAWTFWAVSLAFSLVSHYISHCALRATLCEIDEDRLDSKHPGGRWTTWTEFVTVLSGICFLLGLGSILWCAYTNLESLNGKAEANQAATIQTTEAAK